MIYFYKIIIFFIVFTTAVFSQKRIVEVNKELVSPRNSSLLQVDVIPFDLMESFIEENLFGFCVDIYDLNITAANGSIGGFFYSGEDFGINEGIILSTGKVEHAVGPNNSTCISSSHESSGDITLNTLNSDVLTFDACVIEFDFIAASDNLLACEFIFASEEYPEYVDSWFNDIFGFFISEPYEIEVGDLDPNISSEPQNIAFLPSSDTPVSINNINESLNSNFYVDNLDGENIQYDGFTIPISLEKQIKQGVVYRLKVAIADGSDDQYDSALFLRSNSFESGVNAEIGNIYQNGLEVSFESNSFGSQFLWDFGDGLVSNLENPTHEYTAPGTYVVSLNVLDDSNCGVSQVTEIITVTNIEEISILENIEQKFEIYFNSDSESIMIKGLQLNNVYYVNIYNTIGKQELSYLKDQFNSNQINVAHLSSGPYFLELRNENFENIFSKKILIY